MNEKLNAAMQDLKAAVAFKRQVLEAGAAGEDVVATGASRDAMNWIWTAAQAVADAMPAPLPEEDCDGWRPLTGPGQVNEGDYIKFELSGTEVEARVGRVIRPGTEKEELVYNRARNHYVITSMAVDESSSHKKVQIKAVRLEAPTSN